MPVPAQGLGKQTCRVCERGSLRNLSVLVAGVGRTELLVPDRATLDFWSSFGVTL